MLHTRGRIHNIMITVYRFWNREYFKPIGRKIFRRSPKEAKEAPCDWSKLYTTECDWLLTRLNGSHIMHMTNLKASLASE